MRSLSLFSFVVLFAFSSCSDPSKKSRTDQKLKLNLYCEPPTLDSRKAVDSTSISVLLMLYEGLTRIGEDHQPAAAVAKEIVISEDKKIYTFYLRDCLWNNGDPVTVHDFIYAWKRVIDPQFPSDYAQKLYVIKNAQKIKEGKLPIEKLGVKAVDDYTLQIELENPTPYFLELTAFPTFFPVHRIIDQKNPDWANDAGPDFVGNGPFQLLDWQHENEIIIEKNPLYWDAKQVRLEEIQLMMISDTTTELHMFESNELDWAGSPLSNLPSEVIPTLKKEGLIYSYPVSAVYYYAFNTERFPFNHKKLRQAFGLAINRQEIIDHILQAGQMPAMSIVPPLFACPEYYDRGYFQDGDVTRAKILFEEAMEELGLSKEQFPPIKLSFNTNREHEKIAQAIQNFWQQAFGVTVALENFEWKVYLSKIYKNDFQIGRMGWVGDINDPISFLEPFKIQNDSQLGGNNPTGWEHSEYIRFLNLSMAELDAKKRLRQLKAAESILMEEMPLIPLYFITHNYLKKSYVKNVYLSSLGLVDFKKAFIDESDINFLNLKKNEGTIR